MKRILTLGDSIGARELDGFPVLIQRILEDRDDTYRVVSSSVPSSNVLDLLDRTYELLPNAARVLRRGDLL